MTNRFDLINFLIELNLFLLFIRSQSESMIEKKQSYSTKVSFVDHQPDKTILYDAFVSNWSSNLNETILSYNLVYYWSFSKKYFNEKNSSENIYLQSIHFNKTPEHSLFLAQRKQWREENSRKQTFKISIFHFI
jgi:hypothetical protein